MAMEGDKDIFKAILEPFILDPITKRSKKQRLETTSTTEVDVEELPNIDITSFN